MKTGNEFISVQTRESMDLVFHDLSGQTRGFSHRLDECTQTFVIKHLNSWKLENKNKKKKINKIWPTSVRQIKILNFEFSRSKIVMIFTFIILFSIMSNVIATPIATADPNLSSADLSNVLNTAVFQDVNSVASGAKMFVNGGSSQSFQDSAERDMILIDDTSSKASSKEKQEQLVQPRKSHL